MKVKLGLLAALAALVVLGPAAEGQQTVALKDKTLIQDASVVGGVGIRSKHSHAGDKSAFVHHGFQPSARVAVRDHMTGDITVFSETSGVDLENQIGWSPNNNFILFGMRTPDGSDHPQKETIAKVNVTDGSVTENVLTPAHLGLSDGHGVWCPDASLDGYMAVNAHDWSQDEGQRMVGVFVVAVDSNGDPIDEDGNGVADQFWQATTGSDFLGLNPIIRGDRMFFESPWTQWERRIFMIENAVTNPGMITFGDPRLFRVDPGTGYVFGVSVSPDGKKVSYGIDTTGNYIEPSFNFNDGDPETTTDADFDAAFDDVSDILAGNPSPLIISNIDSDEAMFDYNFIATTATFSSSSGLYLCTISWGDVLIIDPETNTVVSPFSINDGAGTLVSADVGDPADAGGAEFVNVTVFTPSSPDEAIQRALDGEVIMFRSLEVSGPLNGEFTWTWEWLDLLLENFSGEEGDITLTTNDPSVTVERISIDTETNTGVWKLSGEFGSAKAGLPIQVGLGVVAPPSPTYEWPNPDALPAAGPIASGLLVGIFVAVGVVFQRRKSLS